VRIITRGGHDWTHRFPAIADAARELGPATMILDGEAVVLDEQRRSDFGLLQNSLGATGKAAGKLRHGTPSSTPSICSTSTAMTCGTRNTECAGIFSMMR
jgi:ATP-dependent DNA ligase